MNPKFETSRLPQRLAVVRICIRCQGGFIPAGTQIRCPECEDELRLTAQMVRAARLRYLWIAFLTLAGGLLALLLTR